MGQVQEAKVREQAGEWAGAKEAEPAQGEIAFAQAVGLKFCMSQAYLVP